MPGTNTFIGRTASFFRFFPVVTDIAMSLSNTDTMSTTIAIVF